jgi:hypothetical protein
LLFNLSHILINATLARSPYLEVTIASYAVAMSLFGLFEKPAVLLRQTCSALVRDRVSFAAMAKVTAFTLTAILLLSLLIAYSPLSEWIFRYGFEAEDTLVNQTTAIYQILIFVNLHPTTQKTSLSITCKMDFRSYSSSSSSKSLILEMDIP